jgi:hypothetical protein
VLFDLAELFDTDRIVPVVIFLRPGTRCDRLQLGGDRHTYLDFRYLSCELHRLAAADHIHSDNLVARLNLPNMAYPPSERLTIYAAAQVGLATLETEPEKQSKYADYIDYYANLSDEELAYYRDTTLQERGDLMGLAQQLRHEGRLEGRQEGRQEGQQEGEARLLRRLLTLRFGPLSEWAEQQLSQATTE